jgi:hypothetical protein
VPYICLKGQTVMSIDCFIIQWSAFPPFLVQFLQFSNRTGPRFSYYKYIVLCGQHRPSLLFVPTGITAKKLLNCLSQRQSEWMVVQFKINKMEIEIVRIETFWKNKQERNQACIVIESFREWPCIVCCEDKELTQQLSKLDTTTDNSRSTSLRNGTKTRKIYTHKRFYAIKIHT